ncbi:MAG TPA: carboxymuconolactone decarboxylase family protein [Roseiarcus sp.]|nr:carboxymuconolactone decarboxylase family protein [Roseiarcus sp.]
MARVPYPSREAYPEAYRSAYDRMLQERGDPAPNIFLAVGNIPNLLGPMLDFTKEMKTGAAIEQRLRELSIVTVGLVTRCDYEFGHHWNIALKAGVRCAQLEQLEHAEASPEFDEKERAIIRYAREATEKIDVSDDTWSALRQQLSLRETMDIVMAVAWYNAVARMLKPMRIETESWYQRA